MEISQLLAEAISAASKHGNQMPLPHSPALPIFCVSDVTTFLHKHESLAACTGTDQSTPNAIAMLPYYCMEEITVTVVMMRDSNDRDWDLINKNILYIFWIANSRPQDFNYRRQYLKELCAESGSWDDMEAPKSFLHMYNHISRVVT
jgi:hypothetical protein